MGLRKGIGQQPSLQRTFEAQRPLSEQADKRISLSTHKQGDGRDNAVAIKESRDEYKPLGTSDRSRDKDRLRGSSKTSGAVGLVKAL